MRRRITALVLGLGVVVVGGLGVTFVSRVRDAAARAQCRNNLRWIVLALHNYAGSSGGTFPPATIPNDRLPPEERLSWLVGMMPFLDQPQVLVDRDKGWDTEENRVPKVRYGDTEDRWREEPLADVPLLQCPAGDARAVLGRPGVTHYVGVAGLGQDAATRGLGYPGTGVFGYERRTPLEDIKDGAANTMLVIETTRDNGPWTAGGFATARGLDPAARPHLGKGGQFASNHRGGTNVGFADGSVRTLNESVSTEAFEAMATVAGGEDVGRVGDE
jgi:prepilin-type processing-associated H-X9-DG protein